MIATLLAIGLGNTLHVPKSPPNIILILVDDMGWKDIGANGSRYYRTPNIDRLAAEGTRFTHGYSASAVCSPSRAALLTGKSPHRLHITDWISGESPPKNARFKVPKWQMSLPQSEITIAEILKQKGYATASIGKWHLGEDGPTSHGFDVGIAGGEIGHPASFFWPYGALKNSHRVPGLALMGNPGEYLTDRLTDEAIKFIDQNRAKPFFLYMPHYAVHAPIQAKESDIAEYRSVSSDGGQSSPIYAGMVKSVDDSVGRITTRIKDLGLDQNTIIVFTSDNGGATHFKDSTSNAPLRAQKAFPYEGGIRVPFIIKAPGRAPYGKATPNPIILTDLAPTLAKWAGAPIPRDLDGVDHSHLTSNRYQVKPLVWHYPHYWGGGLMSPFSAIRLGQYKLVRWYEFDSEELYDLESDPFEKSDLSAKLPKKRQELSGRLSRELSRQQVQMPVAHNPPRPARDPATNPALAEKFR